MERRRSRKAVSDNAEYRGARPTVRAESTLAFRSRDLPMLARLAGLICFDRRNRLNHYDLSVAASPHRRYVSRQVDMKQTSGHLSRRRPPLRSDHRFGDGYGSATIGKFHRRLRRVRRTGKIVCDLPPAAFQWPTSGTPLDAPRRSRLGTPLHAVPLQLWDSSSDAGGVC